MPGAGTQFHCFASTKVQILTPEELRAAESKEPYEMRVQFLQVCSKLGSISSKLGSDSSNSAVSVVN